jgi:hypothetical protein
MESSVAAFEVEHAGYVTVRGYCEEHAAKVRKAVNVNPVGALERDAMREMGDERDPEDCP